MIAGALRPYETGLVDGSALELRATDGRRVPLDLTRYLSAPDGADRDIVRRCRAAAIGGVLDVGCGPGRMVHALAAAGVISLGIDIAETAVELAQARGGSALNRDLFGRVPGAGRWGTALLMDGNIGIGGDVDRILTRLRTLLAPGGEAFVEVDPDDSLDERLHVRFSRAGRAIGPAFDWAVIGSDRLLARATACGFTGLGTWSQDGRAFVRLGGSAHC